MRRSAIYLGRLRHRRLDAWSRTFTHRVWHVLLDLDELPELVRQIPILSHNRFNLLGFDDSDHMRPERSDVRSKLAAWLEAEGVAPPEGRVLLLTNLRQLGHVFNPVSFYYCHDRSGALRHVVAEVNSTFGETCCYLLESSGGGPAGVVRDEHDKVFHVSPFQPVDGSYRFRVTPPGERLTVHIDLLREGLRVFDATLSAERRRLSTATLAGALLRHPHVTLRNVALIHLHALRLWLRGAPFHAKPSPPEAAWRTRDA